MIGGTDIIIDLGPGKTLPWKAIETVFRAAWPKAVVSRLGYEFFVYEDRGALLSWMRKGQTSENRDQMIHLLVEASRVTCVVGGPLGTRIAEAIRGAVRTT